MDFFTGFPWDFDLHSKKTHVSFFGETSMTERLAPRLRAADQLRGFFMGLQLDLP